MPEVNEPVRKCKRGFAIQPAVTGYSSESFPAKPLQYPQHCSYNTQI